jgi:hypothetical protein
MVKSLIDLMQKHLNLEIQSLHAINAMAVMRVTFYVPVVLLAIFLAGCAAMALPPVAFSIPTRIIDYQKEVKPLLDKRCTVCHSCYNSPCQLKLDSFEGADRGATKRAIYNSTRLITMEPTRLFTDAQSTAEWRKKKFFSVTESSVSNGLNDSIMIQLLSHKMKSPKSAGEYQPESEDLTCSENTTELGGYGKHLEQLSADYRRWPSVNTRRLYAPYRGKHRFQPGSINNFRE